MPPIRTSSLPRSGDIEAKPRSCPDRTPSVNLGRDTAPDEALVRVVQAYITDRPLKGLSEPLPARQGGPRGRRIPPPARMAIDFCRRWRERKTQALRDTTRVFLGVKPPSCGRAFSSPNPTGHLSQAARKIGTQPCRRPRLTPPRSVSPALLRHTALPPCWWQLCLASLWH